MKSRIIIQNLKCGGCAKTILEKLSAVNGIENTRVILDEDAVVFEHQQEGVEIEVKAILNKLGYPSIEQENGLMSKARSVVSCAGGRLKS